MFTAVEYTYLKDLVNTYILNGDYNYYLAYTNTDLSGSYTSDTIDFYVIFSKDNIEGSSNTFSIPSKSLSIGVNSSQAQRNQTNGPRYEFTEFGGTVSVNSYEFIYTNANNSKYADLLAHDVYQEKLNQESNIAYNITKDEFYILPLFFGLLIMMLFLKWCFPMKGGKKA